MKYTGKSAFFIIQPWTLLRCDEEILGDILDFASKLKEKQVPIIYETYSSYFIEDVYDLADIRVIYRIKDPNDILPYLEEEREENEGGDSDNTNPYSSKYIWDPEHDIHPNQDYERVIPDVIDPYNDDVVGFVDKKEEFKDYHTWMSIYSGFKKEKMSSNLKKRIFRDNSSSNKKDFELKIGGDPKTKVMPFSYRYDHATSFMVKCLNKLNPKIKYFLISGGYSQSCLSERIESMNRLKVKAQRLLLSEYIAVRSGTMLEDLHDHKSIGLIQSRKDKLLSDHYESILDYF